MQVEIPAGASERQLKHISTCVAELQNEIAALKQLDHPNIVRYLGCEQTDNAIRIFLEWLAGGTIAQALKSLGALQRLNSCLLACNCCDAAQCELSGQLPSKRTHHSCTRAWVLFLSGDSFNGGKQRVQQVFHEPMAAGYVHRG